MKKSIIAILMGGVIGFTSCDSFLDEAPQSSITPEVILTMQISWGIIR